MLRVQLDLDDRRHRYSLPWSCFPQSFSQDVEAMAHVNADQRRERSAVAARIIRDGAMAWARDRQ